MAATTVSGTPATSTPDTSSSAAAAAASPAAASSSPAEDARGKKRTANDRENAANAAAASAEQKLQEGMAHLSQLSSSLASGSGSATVEAANKMRADLEGLVERVRQLEAEKKEAEDRAKQEKLEGERKRIKALVTDVLAMLEPAMKEAGQDPATDETLNALRGADSAKTLEELSALDKAAQFAVKCAMPLKHRAQQRDEAMQRAAEATKTAADAQQAIAATSAHMSSMARRVAEEGQRSATSGLASRVQGFQWPSMSAPPPVPVPPSPSYSASTMDYTPTPTAVAAAASSPARQGSLQRQQTRKASTLSRHRMVALDPED